MFQHEQGLLDDARCVQLIGIMDKMLKRENLDLRLTPYWVLPMSASSGIMQFVPSATLQDLTAKGKAEGVLRYLAEHSPSMSEQRAADVHHSKLHAAIAPSAMENFIRSNAGYAIISYLLDMGDRHLENLLLTKDGKLFHIGEAFICTCHPVHIPLLHFLCCSAHVL
jgi:phosphatidylinositol 3-kinase